MAENGQKKEKPKYSVLDNIGYIIGNLWRWDKIILLYAVLQALTGVLLPALGIYLPKLVIDEISNASSPERLIISIGSVSLLIAGLNFVSSFSIAGAKSSDNLTRSKYWLMINNKIMDCDYDFLESSAGQTKRQKAMQSVWEGSGGHSGIVSTFATIASSVLGFFLYSSIITMLNPLIMILLAASSFINYFVLKYIAHYEHGLKDKWTPARKKLYYTEVKSSDFENAKDVRLYKMRDWFVDNYTRFIDEQMYWVNKVRSMQFMGAVSNAFVILLRDGFAYVYLIYAITSGKIAISDFVLYFGAVAGFSGFVTGIVSGYNTINIASLYTCDIREYLEMPNKHPEETSKPMPLIDVPPSIRFKDVCFRYTDEGEYVIKDLNLEIAAGQKLALVGANGVGKTTIVKLLCGFYRPTSGEILINNIPTTELSLEGIHSLISAIFQDIVILPLSVAKNVALCKEEKINRERVKRCLELANISERLSDIDAQLQKAIEEDGIELSGGQQQKLMMARALYKDAPIMLLDEPTAALDPIAESELYHKYNELAKNKTSIFISHRLASTHFCDKVAYIEGGTVAEFGTHDELMAKKGRYAEIFDIQSHYYRENN